LPVVVIGAKASQYFVQAKHVGGDLDRSRLIEQGDGFGDLGIRGIVLVLVISLIVIVPAFDEARSDAHFQTPLRGGPRLALERYAEEWRRRLQPSVNRSRASSKRLNSKAHMLKRGMIRLHDVLATYILAYSDACT
jgi:hypothetical protein